MWRACVLRATTKKVTLFASPKYFLPLEPPPVSVSPTFDNLDALCCKGELRATWSVSSTSSEDDLGEPAVDADTKPQFSSRNPAYTATRVFYRSDRQAPETSANIGDSSDGDTLEDIRTNRQSRTADNSNTNNNRQPRDRNYYKNNEYLNNKSAKFKSDRAEGGKRADIVDKRENYKYNSQDRRNVSRDTTKQQRGNATNSGHNDNDTSKQRNENESRNVASLKTGRRESDSAVKERDSATSVDNMRYSSNRRSPRKWKVLPIPAPNYKTDRSAEPSPSVPFDDRRPYRRNLPPRILAKLKAKNSTSASAAEEAATTTTSNTTSCNGGTDSNDEVTQEKVDVINSTESRQNDGKLQAQCMRARNACMVLLKA